MPDNGLTQQLAAWSLSSDSELPNAVIDQARRAFLNYLGCALGGVDEPAAIKIRAHADEFSGARNSTVIGRTTKLDAQHAALVNCLQSSIQTFDDTHLPSVIHPTGPVAAAMMALLEHRPTLEVTGVGFLAALAHGIEISCRVAGVMTAPGSGMHLGVFTTGVTGSLGGAVACGRLLGLDVQRQSWAIGIAAAQAAGLRASHGTLTGGLVPGLSARAGLLAALLAADNFDASEKALEGRNGLFEVLAPGAQAGDLVDGIGRRFEMSDLSYKPYPCGIVIHPTIDACLDIAARAAAEPVQTVELRVNPLTLQLTGTRHPANALSCNMSVFHWAASALLRARAGLAEATDAARQDPAIADLRCRIVAVPDEAMQRDEAIVQVQLMSGSSLTSHVTHARGSIARPLTEAELASKFLTQASPCLGDARSRHLLALCNALPEMQSSPVATLAAASTPLTKDQHV